MNGRPLFRAGRQFNLVAIGIFDESDGIAASAVLHGPRLPGYFYALGPQLITGLVDVGNAERNVAESVADIVRMRVPIVGELDDGVGFF
jgi:hypothetical protein